MSVRQQPAPQGFSRNSGQRAQQPMAEIGGLRRQPGDVERDRGNYTTQCRFRAASKTPPMPALGQCKIISAKLIPVGFSLRRTSGALRPQQSLVMVQGAMAEGDNRLEHQTEPLSVRTRGAATPRGPARAAWRDPFSAPRQIPLPRGPVHPRGKGGRSARTALQASCPRSRSAPATIAARTPALRLDTVPAEQAFEPAGSADRGAPDATATKPAPRRVHRDRGSPALSISALAMASAPDADADCTSSSSSAGTAPAGEHRDNFAAASAQSHTGQNRTPVPFSVL